LKMFSLKKDMLIGVASAATQIEGGGLDHSWNDWYRRGKIADNTDPSRANDHWNRWQEDAALMREMGLQISRMGVEWARIEPQEGVFDETIIKRYLEEIKLLKTYGIRVLVTLHHFTNPMWFENMGAFSKVENITYYLRFVEKVVTAFGEHVSEYITINEPNVYATNGYFFGNWPPGGVSFPDTVKIMSVMAAAHLEGYDLIHGLRRKMGYSDTKVSFANHVRVFAPKNPANPKDRFFANLTERFFQGSLTRALMTGMFQFPLKNERKKWVGSSKCFCDFIAVNYYTRSSVSGLKDGTAKNVPVNDLGWEIYPQGIVECAKKLHDLRPLPIYITENGTCDNSDSFRSLYLYDHLKALCESDLPFERYYHWCFCDNFEWVEGESARFGIVHIDYETQQRTIKKSGKFLSAIIKTAGVDEPLYDEYVKGQKYPTS